MKALTMSLLLAVSGHQSYVSSDQSQPNASNQKPTLIGLSCSPRKTCSRTVESCEEAYWLLQNCTWGGKLDGDNDGVPCENICPGG
jgi:hypothetical protein